MPSEKPNKGTTKQSRGLARVIVEARRKLRTLLSLVEDGYVPSATEVAEAQALRAAIIGKKEALVALGVDPLHAIASISVTKRKKSGKPKRLRVKGRRKGGVGVYGIGPKVKMWK